MTKKKPTPKHRHEAIDLDPLIDAVLDAVVLIREEYATDGDMGAAFLNLQATVGDLEEAIDENDKASHDH